MDIAPLDKDKHHNITNGLVNDTNHVIFYCPGPISCEYWKVVLGRIKRSFIQHPEYEILYYQYAADKNVPQV